MTIAVSVLDCAGSVSVANSGTESAYLWHTDAYKPGDRIVVEVSDAPCFITLSLDAALAPATIYLKEKRFSFPVPFEGQRKAYAPQAFAGNGHRIVARFSSPAQVEGVRNLAINSLDFAENSSSFPHVTATAETRGEAAFAVRNVIDGEIAANDHGFWPFTSWGINGDPDASMTIAFGRPVRISEVVLFTRADYPHDAWWEKASITFSDGWSTDLALGKVDGPQRHAIAPRVTEWLKLDRLIKADDPSVFPALTQIEAWGEEV